VSEAYGFIDAQKSADEPSSQTVLKIWSDAGYPLGNHTYSHFNLNRVPLARFVDDIKANEAMLATYAKSNAQKWFRYPFLHEGDTMEKRNQVRTFLRERGYQIAQVTIDFEDWVWNNAYVRCTQRSDAASFAWLGESYLQNATLRLNHAQALAKKTYARDIGHVLLFHIGVFDSLMLDSLLDIYEKAGVQFVSLAQAQEDPAYTADPGLTPTHGETFLHQFAAFKKIKDPSVHALPLEKLRLICN